MAPHHSGHFKSFSKITSLTLSHISFTLLDSPISCHSFRDFIPTLRSLRLLCPTACPRALFRFISVFSNLQDTAIHSPSWDKPGDTPVGSFGPCHGELRISEFDGGSSQFLSLLESQATNYERLTIRECSFDDIRPLQRFVSANGQSMRRLHIVVAERGEHCLPSSVRPILKCVIQERFRQFRSRIARPSNKSVSVISGPAPRFTRFLRLFHR